MFKVFFVPPTLFTWPLQKNMQITNYVNVNDVMVPWPANSDRPC